MDVLRLLDCGIRRRGGNGMGVLMAIRAWSYSMILQGDQHVIDAPSPLTSAPSYKVITKHYISCRLSCMGCSTSELRKRESAKISPAYSWQERQLPNRLFFRSMEVEMDSFRYVVWDDRVHLMRTCWCGLPHHHVVSQHASAHLEVYRIRSYLHCFLSHSCGKFR